MSENKTWTRAKRTKRIVHIQCLLVQGCNRFGPSFVFYLFSLGYTFPAKPPCRTLESCATWKRATSCGQTRLSEEHISMLLATRRSPHKFDIKHNYNWIPLTVTLGQQQSKIDAMRLDEGEGLSTNSDCAGYAYRITTHILLTTSCQYQFRLKALRGELNGVHKASWWWVLVTFQCYHDI